MPRLYLLTAALLSFLPARAFALVAPSSFTCTALSTTSLDWYWVDNSTDEIGYRVMSGTLTNVSGNLAANTTSWVQAGLTANTQYGPYTAEAYTSSATVDSSSSTCYTLAGAPASLAFTSVSSSAISISWSANGNPGSTLYIVQRSTGAGYATVSSGTTTSFTDSAVTSSVTYSYQVAAENGGSIATSFTGPISTTTSGGATAPAAPTAFAGSAQSASSILWSWTDNASNETGYRVIGGTINISGNLAANTTSWLQTGLSANTLYGNYQAEAYNSSGTADSSAINRYTLANTPSSLAFVSVSTSAISISWSANGNPGGTIFNVQRSTGGGYTTVSSGTSTSYTDSSVTSSTTYSYQVDAQNGNAIATSYTGPISTTTGSGVTAPAAPTGFAGSAQSATSILWSWTDNANNETGYRVLGGTINVSGDLAANTTSWLQTGLSANTLYGNYLAEAFNSSGTADSSATNRYTLADAPASLAFTGVSASAVSISWSANGNPAGTTFNVQRSTGGGYTTISSGTSTSYTDTSVTPATIYDYQVQAVNGNGVATAFAGPISTATSTGGPWTLLDPLPDPTTGVPTLRVWNTAVYNPNSKRMIVFAGGGPGGYGLFNDVWVLSNADGVSGTPAWTRLTPTGGPPPAREDHAAVYDVANNRMIVHGGYTTPGFCGGVISDVWVLSNADGTGGTPTWTQLSPTGTAPARRYAGEAYDSVNNRLIVNGGANSGCGSGLNDTWVLTNANGLGGTPAWIQLFPSTPAGFPSDMSTGSAGYDSAHNTFIRVLQFNNVATTWLLSNANGLGGAPAWTQLAIGTVPSVNDGIGRDGLYDAGSNNYIFFGGGVSVASETWVLSGANGVGNSCWTKLAPSGATPVQRVWAALGYSSSSAVMTMWGGSTDSWHGTDEAWTLSNPFGMVPACPLLPITAPSGFAGTAQSASSILWTWTDNAGNESGYRVLSGTINVSGDLAADTTSWLQTGLPANAQYSYLAQAFNSSGTANSGSASRYTLANVPASLAFTSVQAGQISLSWSANGNAGSPIYELQRSTGAGFATISSGTATSYTDLGVSPTSSYQYQVRAYNGDSVATVFTSAISTTTPAAASGPAAPTGFAGAAQSASSILWAWADNASNEAGYRVLSGTINVSGNLAANTTSWLQTGLAANTQYGAYAAQAFNSTGTANSGSASRYTLANVPGSFAFTSVLWDQISLSWTANGSAGSPIYELQRSTGGPFATISSGTATSYTDNVAASSTYQYQVRAYNGDSIASAFAGPISTTTPAAPTAPAAPTNFTGAAASTTAIAWSWTDNAGNESGYRVLSGTASLSGNLAANTASWTQTGLSPNTAYGPYAAEAFNGIGTADSSTGPVVYTLAAPPTSSAASGIQAESVTLTWSRGADPAATVAEVQRSNDGTTYTQMLLSPATYFLDTSVIGCTTYYYRVREQNRAGVSTAFDSVVQLLTPNTVPHPALGLSALSLPGNRISLSWTPSPTEGITGYRLFFDNGSGTISYAAPLAVFSSTSTSYTTGLLISSAAYSFALRADHRCGTEETTGVFAAAGSTGTLANVRAVITAPDAGKHINGNSVTIVADLAAGTYDQVSELTFQYRPSGTSSWLNVPAANVNHPNPDTVAPYFMQWDVTGLAPGNYDLRAVAVNVAGSSDTAPSIITVVVDPVTPDIDESLVGGKVQKQQLVDTTVPNTIESSGAGANDPVVHIAVPSGALSGSTVTATVVVNPVITTAPPAGLSSVGSMLQIDLSNGQHQLSGGETAKLTMSYPENVTDPSTLQIWSLNALTGQWTKDFASTVDTTSRTVSGLTPHFSVFAIFAGAPAAADLSSVRVYPVPFKPNGGNPDEGKPFSAGDPTSGIVFDNLPSAVTIKIYTMTGRLVAKFDQSTGAGQLHWDVRNQEGRDVASGGYFAVISSPGYKSVVKKIAIIR